MPVLVIIVMLIPLYLADPSVRRSGLRWITLGSLLAVVIWITTSGASRTMIR